MLATGVFVVCKMNYWNKRSFNIHGKPLPAMFSEVEKKKQNNILSCFLPGPKIYEKGANRRVNVDISRWNHLFIFEQMTNRRFGRKDHTYYWGNDHLNNRSYLLLGESLIATAKGMIKKGITFKNYNKIKQPSIFKPILASIRWRHNLYVMT